MTLNQWLIVGAVVGYALVFFTGFRLSRRGKPYNIIVSSLHKLISLAALAALIIVMVRANRVAALGEATWATGAVTGLLFLGTMATGGLLSMDRPMPRIVRQAHRILPYLTVINSALTLVLAVGGL
jgi:hypothetical protein